MWRRKGSEEGSEEKERWMKEEQCGTSELDAQLIFAGSNNFTGSS
jgi:hypothetical protein